MVIWIVKPVGVHVVDHLLEHGSLQHLTQDGQDGHWSVIFGLKFTALSFVLVGYIDVS